MANQKLSALSTATVMASTDRLYGVIGGASQAVTLKDFGLIITGVFDVKRDFGAVGDNVTEDTAAFQAAIDAAAINAAAAPPAGTAVVYAPAGHYKLGQITLKDRVRIIGDSIPGTVLQAKANLNDHLFIGENFASLTGTNEDSHLNGVLTHWGFENLRIDGNQANQTSGPADCIRVYGKSPFFRNVMVYNGRDNGLYTELGLGGGANTWPTSFAGHVEGLWTFNNGDKGAARGHGWHNRGPHDLHIDSFVSYLNGLDGIFNDSDGSTFIGTMDVKWCHIFANGRNGIRDNHGNWRGGIVIVENSDAVGVQFIGASGVTINSLRCYANAKVSGTYQVQIDGTSSQVQINNFEANRMGRDVVGACQIIGDRNVLRGSIQGGIDGGGDSTGTAVDIQNGATHNIVDVDIQTFRGAGGKGLRTGGTGGILHNHVKATIRDCSQLWNNVNAGQYNFYQINGKANAGQTVFAGAGPNSDDSERWEISCENASGTNRRSRTKVEHGTTVDLNSTTEQSFTIPHNLITTPDIDDVQVSLSYTGSNTTWALQYIFVSATDATNVTVKVKLSTAAGVAETGNILMRVDL